MSACILVSMPEEGRREVDERRLANTRLVANILVIFSNICVIMSANILVIMSANILVIMQGARLALLTCGLLCPLTYWLLSFANKRPVIDRPAGLDTADILVSQYTILVSQLASHISYTILVSQCHCIVVVLYQSVFIAY